MPATRLSLGPLDAGRSLTLEEYEEAEYEGGVHYELIDGRLVVSPEANFPENRLERWLLRALDRYSDARPDIVNYVSNKTRVFVHGRRRSTCPEPDVAAYRNVPLDLPSRQIRWQDVSPLLVCEILVDGDPRKDLVRNAALYLEVPSVLEYWVIDGRDDPDEPSLIAHRRDNVTWAITTTPYGGTYLTPLLPDFALVIDPRR